MGLVDNFRVVSRCCPVQHLEGSPEASRVTDTVFFLFLRVRSFRSHLGEVKIAGLSGGITRFLRFLLARMVRLRSGGLIRATSTNNSLPTDGEQHQEGLSPCRRVQIFV